MKCMWVKALKRPQVNTLDTNQFILLVVPVHLNWQEAYAPVDTGCGRMLVRQAVGSGDPLSRGAAD